MFIKIKKISFSHYGDEITGGLYMYDFICRDKKLKEMKISYRVYCDLSCDTLDNLKIEE